MHVTSDSCGAPGLFCSCWAEGPGCCPVCVCDILLQETLDSFQAHAAVGGRKGPYQSKLFCSVVFNIAKDVLDKVYGLSHENRFV